MARKSASRVSSAAYDFILAEMELGCATAPDAPGRHQHTKARSAQPTVVHLSDAEPARSRSAQSVSKRRRHDGGRGHRCSIGRLAVVLRARQWSPSTLLNAIVSSRLLITLQRRQQRMKGYRSRLVGCRPRHPFRRRSAAGAFGWQCRSDAWCWLGGAEGLRPFQQGLRRLPPRRAHRMVACLVRDDARSRSKRERRNGRRALGEPGARVCGQLEGFTQ